MDYQRILGLDGGETPEQIKAKYRQMAKKYHPDVCKDPASPEMFRLVSDAYQYVLKNNPPNPIRYTAKPKQRSSLDIYRVLNDAHKEHGVILPFNTIPENTRFHFILGMEEFSILFEKETPLPVNISVRLNIREIPIRILSDGRK